LDVVYALKRQGRTLYGFGFWWNFIFRVKLLKTYYFNNIKFSISFGFLFQNFHTFCE
jgi:hypothetical protein